MAILVPGSVCGSVSMVDTFQSVTDLLQDSCCVAVLTRNTARTLITAAKAQVQEVLNAIQKKPRQSKIKSMSKAPFRPGDIVYARWFGDEALVIVDQASVNSHFPHYICETIDKVRYVMSKLHLSRSPISPHTNDSNRRQLPIPGIHE